MSTHVYRHSLQFPRRSGARHSQRRVPPTPLQATARSASLGGFQAEGLRAPAMTAPAKAKPGYLARLGDAFLGLLTGFVCAAAGVVMNLVEMVVTFGRGIGRFFKKDVGGGFGQLGLVFVKAVQTPLDAVLMLGGRLVSAVQTLITVEPVGRKLSDAETAELRKVYGDSIHYRSVRLKEGQAGLMTLFGRPFTHGDIVFIPASWLPVSTDLLVHELAHVWQHQNGGTDYMSEALWAQNFGDGYDFEKGLKEGRAWSDLNPEQQAEFLQVAWSSGYFSGPGRSFSYNGVDYTAQLDAAVRQVRDGRGAP